MRTAPVRRARRERRRASGARSAAGWPAGASTASTWPSSTCATTPGSSSAWSTARSTLRSEYVVRVDRHGAPAPRGHGEPDARHRRRSRSATARWRCWPRPSRRRSRSTTGSRSTRRCGCATATSTCAGPHAAQPAAAGGRQRGHPPGHGPPGLLRGRDAAAVGARRPRAPASSPCPSRSTTAPSTCCPRAPSSPSSCSWSAGFDRYYQIARCMRDEDLRADRQFEFTQLDMEASFVDPGRRARRSCPRPCSTPPRRPPASGRGRSSAMTWAEAIDRYGTDKPDLRFGMELVDLSARVRRHRGQGLRRARRVKAMRARGRRALAPVAPRRPGRAGQGARGQGAGLVPGDRRRRRPGSTRRSTAFLSDEERAGIADGDRRRRRATSCWSWPTSTARPAACSATCALDLGGPPVGEGPHRYVWVVEFPMFDGVDDDGNPVPAHHPFTMPHPDDLDLLETRPAAGALPGLRPGARTAGSSGRAASGSTAPTSSARVFARARASATRRPRPASASCSAPSATARRRTPASPSASTGWWPSSAGEENIREVIAFPKTQSGADLMTGAPKPLAPGALAELGIRVVRRRARAAGRR